MQLYSKFLSIDQYEIDNRSFISCHISSLTGFDFEGIDFSLSLPKTNLSNFSGSVHQIHVEKNRIKATKVSLKLPQELIQLLSQYNIPIGNLKQLSMQYDGDLSYQEGRLSIHPSKLSLNYYGYDFQFNNIEGSIDKTHCYLLASYLKENISFSIETDLSFLQDRQGFLNLIQSPEKQCKIAWDFKNGFTIQHILGEFLGLESSFCDHKGALIGKAQIDFQKLMPLLPSPIREIDQKLMLQDGYSLRGKLDYQKQFKFEGNFGGKNFSFLGYRFNSFDSQILATLNSVEIKDFSISDLSGFLSVDAISFQNIGDNKAFFDIPKIHIKDFRPALLQSNQGIRGEITPLVIRNFYLFDFSGYLFDKNTYKGMGKLEFLNSYKRGGHIFDGPADMFSRIFGLDVELMIPVSGLFYYDIDCKKVKFKKLVDAYSEGRRSEFFFSSDDSYIDFDGNLDFKIKMKQYVLFKFTENFIVSIQGNVQNPQFKFEKRKE